MNMNANTLNAPRSQSQTEWSSQGVSSSQQFQPVDDVIEYVTSYARQNPGTAALWCFGIGFILGWRLKPW